MPSNRRGLSPEERLAVNAVQASATKTLVSSPCFLYSVVCVQNDTNATGDIVLADTTASAAGDINTDTILRVRLGAGGASAGGGIFTFLPPKPIFIANTLVVSAASANVSVSYLPVT